MNDITLWCLDEMDIMHINVQYLHSVSPASLSSDLNNDAGLF